ncbi:hypothetical protein SAMN02800694_0388 [Luteibacter sp. UNCMF331Sha3.1]|uniref:TlpA family protein disulfide reductase n=1 Tax=Luteibacter sp. UNCMF331Sha3.1 TaxID=1502760 RepID=UPI0008C57306|nr:hypothetical protein [Luteibacter sp. UNCMF331Sha3.1]SEM25474.1 hypothetical protein SAMN02800694_0388 [Luteibacter sp. UNCMF331Sha3.1]
MKPFMFLLAAAAFAMPAFATPPVALTAADVPALLAPPSKGVRVIALWALDCAYCEANLSALADFRAGHPDVDLVIVATDPVSQAATLDARLKAAKLDALPTRAYADATPDRLNFLIDPAWGGETPRTMIIRADGTRRAASGMLDSAHIATLVR